MKANGPQTDYARQTTLFLAGICLVLGQFFGWNCSWIAFGPAALSHSFPPEKERRDLAPVLVTLTYPETFRDGISFDPGVQTDWFLIFCGQFAPVLCRGRRRRATNRISRVRRGLVSEQSDLQAMHLCIVASWDSPLPWTPSLDRAR